MRRIHAILKAHAASHGPRSYYFSGISESRDKLNEAVLTRDPPKGYKLSKPKDWRGHFVLVRQPDAPPPTKTDIGLLADDVLNLADYNAAIDGQQRQDALDAAITQAMVLYQEGDDEIAPAPKGFAEQINEIARDVETSIPGGGKFAHKASIAEIYDAYGRKQPDAGSLAEFKARLLDAHNKGEIDLLPLDDPKSMDPALRARSAIKTEYNEYHFVDRRRATEAPPAAPIPTAAPPQNNP